jgi:Transposase DDE domain
VGCKPTLREARARIRRHMRGWQKQCDVDDPNEGTGNEVDGSVMERLERLQKSGLKKLSRGDPDSGFFSRANLDAMEDQSMGAYVPDTNLARVLNRGGSSRHRAKYPAHQGMRRKLRNPAGRALYARSKAIVETVNGLLKEQRGMRRFRRKGLQEVEGEWILASIAYNLTRMRRVT